MIATARDASAVLNPYPHKPGELLAVNADVTEPDRLTAAVEAGPARFGRIDNVVNNAGYGLVGVIEETSDQATRATATQVDRARAAFSAGANHWTAP